MKYTKILGIALLACGITLLSCGQQSGETQGPDPQQAAKAEIATPTSIIPLEQAQVYYDRYSTRRVPLIQQYEDSVNRSTDAEARFDVARYVSFDYETLKQYMAYIEQEAGRVDSKIVSLRVYFGNNPDEKEKVHPKQNTVMLVPAVKPMAESEAEWGLYINNGKAGFLGLDLKPADPKAMGMEMQLEERSEAGMLPSLPLTAQGGGGSLIMNEGGSAPPPYN